MSKDIECMAPPIKFLKLSEKLKPIVLSNPIISKLLVLFPPFSNNQMQPMITFLYYS